MAQSLTPGETDALLERFGYCYDSLIHRIEFVGRKEDGTVRLDLLPGTDYRNGPNGNEPPSPDHESPCYFVGRELSWEFQPYAA
ncbi:hypothetical protein F0U59_51920 [Archangium gephyra]|nr:hypothetical protein F0U59_51920 [Archangium gephyra]